MMLSFPLTSMGPDFDLTLFFLLVGTVRHGLCYGVAACRLIFMEGLQSHPSFGRSLPLGLTEGYPPALINCGLLGELVIALLKSREGISFGQLFSFSDRMPVQPLLYTFK